MADGNLTEIFRDKHREFLHLIDRVWVGFDSSRDRLTLTFRVNGRLPPEWVRSLKIELYHEDFGLQESAEDVVWIDLEGSLLTATCKRPRKLLPDASMPASGTSVLPIGDVILFAGDERFMYEHPLYNEFGQRVMSRDYDPFRPRRKTREDEVLPR